MLGEPNDLTATSDLDLIEQPLDGRELALAGPSVKLDPLHRPVRGDLAHIALAGKVFVPHYAVPMPHAVAAGGVTLRKAGRADGEAICDLAGGETFNVLDMAGGWAWGQQDNDGFVGYVPLTALVAA
ncbi:MAG: hypothetical protein RIS94_2245 [Pseudomonadota bacterium]|jgi:hypothetical protein